MQTRFDQSTEITPVKKLVNELTLFIQSNSNNFNFCPCDGWPEVDESLLFHKFTPKLLHYIAHHSEKLSEPFMSNAIAYCHYAYAHMTCDKFFHLALRAGNLTVAKMACNLIDFSFTMFLCDNTDFALNVEELFYVSAIKSGSEEVILYLNHLYVTSGQSSFISSETVQQLEEQGINQGLDVLQKLVNQRELDDIRRAILTNNLQDEIATIKKHELSTCKLISMAVKANANKINIENILNLDKTFDLDSLAPDEFIYLAFLGIPNPQQFYHFLTTHKPVIQPNQLSFIIQNYGNDETILNQLIDAYAESLKPEDLFAIVESNKLSWGLIEKLLKLPVGLLLQNNFIEHLFFQSISNEKALAQIHSFLFRETTIDQIKKEGSVTMLALLVANGYSLKPEKNMDYVSILLMAISFCALQKKDAGHVYQILENLDAQQYPIKKTHLVLAGKLDKKMIVQWLTDKKSETPESSERLKILQGGIRTLNRAQNVYPTLLKPSENSYLFWVHTKPKSRVNNLSQELYSLVLPYLKAHELELINGQCIVALSPYTAQYIKREENLQNIFKSAYLLSEYARINEGMPGFPTSNTKEDRGIQDDRLVCTAPLQIGIPGSYAKVNINLTKLPISYLQHCVIKMNDYASKKSGDLYCSITPSIQLILKSTDDQAEAADGPVKSAYEFVYFNEGQTHTCTVRVPAENELFHGMGGFREALAHILCVIDALPGNSEGKIIKDAILKHFQLLAAENTLHEHLDAAFKKLFQFMEIDFVRGLPLSLEYIESLEFLKTTQKLDFNEFFDSLRNENFSEFKDYLNKYPNILGQPVVLAMILKEVPAHRFYEISSLLEKQFPGSYASLELIELNQRTKGQLWEHANHLALKAPINCAYNLEASLASLKNYLSDHPQERQKLIERHGNEVKHVLAQVKKLYQEFSFAGGNSKIIQLFTNPEIMSLFTGKNKGVIAAILAFELEAELQQKPYSEHTFVQDVRSQRTKKLIRITLGSILESALKLPPYFIETTPINLKSNLSEIEAIKEHIKQRCFCNQTYTNLEQALLELTNSYSLDQVASQGDEVYTFDQGEWEQYAGEMDALISAIPADFYNNANLPGEVNRGLKTLLEYLKLDSTPPTLEVLIEKFLSSSAILDPQVSHMLFDSTHFAVALKDNGIDKISLADNIEISFSELMLACMEKIRITGVNENNAMIAQQLVLRMQWLQFEIQPVPNLSRSLTPTS
ncbi:hypothetical protein [Legionella parisiensis]|uniref:Uncharacterized protein n=1 Tax=Legionella parisiensis TaxID=45071 RepID=A0A1E5JVK3_9GAMM|nr:hypothetical protein [Legionella parisiensis]KTD43134.1 hypothetical protein Lpar_1111 [Legionella parisiensis]OEH48576.1 hypothetical protein lpari_00411 [Legionella parisiensis]STX77787.1 Uncharacterised protein [Legionella parisiensis]